MPGAVGNIWLDFFFLEKFTESVMCAILTFFLCHTVGQDHF